MAADGDLAAGVTESHPALLTVFFPIVGLSHLWLFTGPQTVPSKGRSGHSFGVRAASPFILCPC